MEAAGDSNWYVYIVYSPKTGRYYVGCTTNPSRRLHEHNNTLKGARALQGQRPVAMVWAAHVVEGKIPAHRIEHFMKRHHAAWKRNLVSAGMDGLDTLLPDHLPYTLEWAIP